MIQYVDVEGTVRVMDGDSVKVTSNLRPATYRIDFSPMSSYSLEEVDALPVRETMYRNREKLLDHIDKSYHKMNRSMGVLLSVAKGIGKLQKVGRGLTVEILNFDKEKEEFESKTEAPFFTSPKMKLEEVSAGPNTGIRGLI